MEETIKTARLVHRAVIGVCVAMLLFAIGPDDSERYAKAIAELEVLDRASSAFEEFNADTQEKLEQDAASVTNGWVSTLREHRDGTYATAISITVPLHRLIRVHPAPMDGTCGNVRDYLICNPAAQVFQDDGDGLLLQSPTDDPSCLTMKDGEFEPCPRVRRYPLTATDNGSGAENKETTGRRVSIDSITIDQFFPSVGSDPAYALAAMRRDGVWVFSVAITGEFRVQPKSDYLAYLKLAKLESVHAAASTVASGGALSNLQTVWAEIRGQKIDGAFKYLANRKEENLQTLSLFGFAVENTIALVGGPAILIAALLYLLVYVSRLKHCVKAGASRDVFPWIALFPGRGAAAMTIFSVLVVPPASIYAMAFRANRDPLSGTAIGMSLAVLVVGGILWLRLWQLRRS